MISNFAQEPHTVALGAQPATLADPSLQPLAPLTSATDAGTSLSGDVTRKLVGGTSALSLGIFIERGCGFLANIPPGLTLLFVFSTTAASLFAALAILRGLHPALTGPLTAAMSVLVLFTMAGLFTLGRRYRWLPTASALASIASSIRARLPHRGTRHV
jgi:hypothetical protein